VRKIKYGGGGFWGSILVLGCNLPKPGFSALSTVNNIYMQSYKKIGSAIFNLTPLSLATLTWRIQATQEAKKRGRKNRCKTRGMAATIAASLGIPRPESQLGEDGRGSWTTPRPRKCQRLPTSAGSALHVREPRAAPVMG
jgi:hypothetical protein